jgi:hypothetical protein
MLVCPEQLELELVQALEVLEPTVELTPLAALEYRKKKWMQ